MNNQLLKNASLSLPTEPTNLIFTGVAGTGKTHRLLEIQQLYDEVIDSSWSNWRIEQIQQYSWCEVVCATLLIEDRMMTVPEIMRHVMIKDKMVATNRSENINQTLWVQLNTHAHPNSETVKYSKRSANFYFDKTSASQWFILEEVKADLVQRLSDLVALYSDDSKGYTHESHKVIRSCMVSFHQSYGYDEFVEGIRPRINPNTGQMQYDIQGGAFLELCNKAASDPEHRYAMLIDEINRANTAQVFGELMSIIEPSKRAGSTTPMTVRLAYSGRPFSVPSNVDIYATMNTQDHSLASLDTAFRRRFQFIDCQPDSTLLGKVIDSEGLEVDIAKLFRSINQRLTATLGNDAQLGHSYFMNIMSTAQLAKRLYKQIIPQIQHHIQQAVAPTQIQPMLKKILYGVLDERKIIDKSIFNEVHISESERDIYHHQNLIANSQVLFNSGFIMATEGNIKSESNNLHSDNSNNLFLSAKPYRQMYDLS